MFALHRWLFLAGCFLFFLAQPSAADTRDWINPAGGSFDTSTNWSYGGVPAPSDTAHFDSVSGLYTVSFPTSPTNDRLILDSEFSSFTVTFDLQGHTYTLTNPTTF